MIKKLFLCSIVLLSFFVFNVFAEKNGLYIKNGVIYGQNEDCYRDDATLRDLNSRLQRAGERSASTKAWKKEKTRRKSTGNSLWNWLVEKDKKFQKKYW
ncbi:MAG: hypothetical protein PHP69_03900 [Candidatus Omnitrophica bacterium]|nr:hypothetical protein [Candidatus Omnitrophota bacterium]MDD5081703.1 hypothetical protein [Candidatus Omnitrophota bacterium]MDD5441159.1 hypothetical protein [Candidatus Omnitrophota bacterium]